MNKDKIADMVIEKEWYKEIIFFLQKAYKISDEQMQLYINGCEPKIDNKKKEEIVNKLEDIFSEDIITKNEEVANNEGKRKE